MNKKILIFGAGSIGNHMAFANIKLRNKVFITDINFSNLKRMKNSIFPSRYGKWNSKISLINYKKVFDNSKYDLIIIGTPPKTHLEILQKIENSNIGYEKILIEKPLYSYKEKSLLLKKINRKNIYVGYNHSVSLSFSYLMKILQKNKSDIKNIMIDWKEGFEGILGAHNWLKNEFESYLGFSKNGGGAIQEHSHGLHLSHVIMKELNYKINKMAYYKQFYNNDKNLYDNLSIVIFKNKKINLKFETDLITYPPKKQITVILKDKKIIWTNNYKKNLDSVLIRSKNNKDKIKLFEKTRSSEFENEISYILLHSNKKNYHNSRLNIPYGIKVMDTIKKFFYDKKNSI